MKPWEFIYLTLMLGLISTTASCAALPGDQGHSLLFGHGPGEPSDIDSTTVKSYQKSVADFQNGNFEAGSIENNQPESWNPSRAGIYLEEETPNGLNRFVRSSRPHLWSQNQLFSVGAWQTVTIGGSVRADFAEALPWIQFQQRSAAGGSLKWENTTRRGGTPVSQWGPLYLSLTKQVGADNFTTYLQTRQDVAWVDYDNLFRLTEEIQNGGFEENLNQSAPGDWLLTGNADRSTTETLTGSGALRLEGNSQARQVVAHSPYVVRYFTTGFAQGDFTVEEIRLGVDGSEVDGSSSHTLSLTTPERFLVQWPLSPEGQAAEVRLRTDNTGSALVDDLSRGWAYAWPEEFEPVTNSPIATTRLAAAWPGQLDSAYIQILDENLIERDILSPLNQDGTSVWVEYNGSNLLAGNYTARFHLENTVGETITIDRAIRIKRGDPWPDSPMNFQTDVFERFGWYWLVPFTERDELTADQIVSQLETIKSEGFSMVFIALNDGQQEVIREATDRAELPYIITIPSVQNEFKDLRGNKTWTPEIVMSKLDAFDPFLDSPYFKGIYIFDEPNVGGADPVQHVKEVMIAMEREGKYPPGLTAISGGFPLYDADYNVISRFEYPIRGKTEDPALKLMEFTDILEEGKLLADTNDRDFWGGVQGYASGGSAAICTWEESMAMLGINLVIGGKGYFVFLYKTLDGLSGIQTPEFHGTDNLNKAYRPFNERIAAIEDIILSINSERIAPPQENIIARVAEGENVNNPDFSSGQFLFLVNPNPRQDVSIEVILSPEGRLKNIETLVESDLSTTQTLELSPGNWGVYNISSTSEVLSITGTSLEKEAPELLPATVLGQINLDRSPEQLNLSDDGNYLVGAGGSGAFGYQITRDSFFGEQFFFKTVWGPESFARYLDTDTIVASSKTFGPFLYDQSGSNMTETNRFLYQTGNALDLLQDPVEGYYWAAQSYWGVSRLDMSAPENLGHIFSQEGDYIRLFGPYESETVLALDSFWGLHRLKNTASGMERELISEDRELYKTGKASPGGLLACPALNRGIYIYRPDSQGNITWSFRLNEPSLIEPDAVAWLSEKTLAVNDPRFGIKFYRINGEDDWYYLGQWRPDEELFYITDIDANQQGLMVVGLDDNSILLLDVSVIPQLGRQSGWMLE